MPSASRKARAGRSGMTADPHGDLLQSKTTSASPATVIVAENGRATVGRGLGVEASDGAAVGVPPAVGPAETATVGGPVVAGPAEHALASIAAPRPRERVARKVPTPRAACIGECYALAKLPRRRWTTVHAASPAIQIAPAPVTIATGRTPLSFTAIPAYAHTITSP